MFSTDQLNLTYYLMWHSTWKWIKQIFCDFFEKRAKQPNISGGFLCSIYASDCTTFELSNLWLKPFCKWYLYLTQDDGESNPQYSWSSWEAFCWAKCWNGEAFWYSGLGWRLSSRSWWRRPRKRREITTNTTHEEKTVIAVPESES